jgi:hypothetical protein
MEACMSNPWFRLYAEILHDHKVQMMTEAYRWRLVALMCLRCNVAETLPDSAIAFQLRLTEKEWQATKKVFIDNKFIDLDGNLINWDKRQFISDSSTERSRKHREKIAMQRCRDVAATPPDTDTDTDTDTEEKKKPKTPIGIFVKKEKVGADEIETEIQKPTVDKRERRTRFPNSFNVSEHHRQLAKAKGWADPDHEFEAFRDYHQAKGNLFLDWDKAFYTWLRNAKGRFAKPLQPDKKFQDEIKKLFHEILPLNPINVWTTDAAKNLQARIEGQYSQMDMTQLNSWRNFFLLVKSSAQIKKYEWHLDYLVREETFAAILNCKRHSDDELAHYQNLKKQFSNLATGGNENVEIEKAKNAQANFD